MTFAELWAIGCILMLIVWVLIGMWATRTRAEEERLEEIKRDADRRFGL